MKIDIYPRNKKQFLRLIDFGKEIVSICKKFKITPIVYGSLAYLIYKKDKNIKVNDIDFLIPGNNFKKIIYILRKKGLLYKYIPEGRSLIIYKGNLNVDLDAYSKKPTKLKTFNFGGLNIKILSLKTLMGIYKRASETSKDNPKENYKKYLTLKKLK